MKEYNKEKCKTTKRMIIIFLVVLSLSVYGCVGNEINDEEITGNTVSREDMAEEFEDTQTEAVSEDTQETDSGIDNSRPSEEDIEWYMELWAEQLKPIMTVEELEQMEKIDWDEDIQPYMEYDWIGDERIDRIIWSTNTWVMQLADLNLDGQPEMLVSEYFYHMKEDLTHVFTIQDGEVVYCGKIIASVAFEENEYFGALDYLPSNYINVYQNDLREFRYLSCEDFLMYDHGYYQIYESTFDESSISYEPIFAIDFGKDSDGNMHYYYVTGDWIENSENAIKDDENYTAFSQVMEEYMKGYEKVDINFTVCEYRVPTLAGELPEEQQEIVRNNILFGFAQALGYVDK